MYFRFVITPDKFLDDMVYDSWMDKKPFEMSRYEINY